MYRCTECHTEYTKCPDYCDCGNDTFEEIAEEEDVREVDSSYADYGDEELIPPSAPPVKRKRKMTKEEAAEYFEAKKEKKKSLIALCVIIFLCIMVFVLPPHRKQKMEVVKEKVAQENIQIPSIEAYWDDTLPSAFKKKDPLANLPVLNRELSSISPVLREYLAYLGKEFNRKWETNLIDSPPEEKTYTTTVVFTINKEGVMPVKKISTYSHHQSLDDSVALALTHMGNVEIPPDDYKGEKIYINFSCDKNKNTNIKYPPMR